MDDLDIHYVHADSKNRDILVYPNGNYYVLHFMTPVKGVVKVDLVSAKVPNSMYNLTDGSNVCTTQDTGIINLTTGFYSAQTLMDQINERLVEQELVHYSQHEGKFYYLTNTPGATFEVHSQEFAKLFGVSQNVVYTASLLDCPIEGFSYAVKSETLVDFSLNEYIFLDLEEFRGPFFNDLYNLKDINAGNMFAVIPMDVMSGQIKTFKETSDYVMSQNLSNPYTNLSKLTVRWYDKNLKLLNFQGFENNGFVLRLYTHRVKEKIKPIVSTPPPLPPPSPPPPAKKEEKRALFGKWAIFTGILGILLFWYFSAKGAFVSRV